jgi:hypothetical protein
LIICTGGECRGVRHDRHFSAASSFQIGVSRGRRTASSGMLALVSQRWHWNHSAKEWLGKLLLADGDLCYQHYSAVSGGVVNGVSISAICEDAARSKDKS